jgi:ribonuclease P protein component
LQNKEYKLLNADDFSSVFNFRKRLSSEHIFLHYAPNTQNHYRIGFVVAKKVEKRAVRRNYMRRSIREVVMHEFDKSVPVDIVFRVKQSYYRSDFNSIRLELLDLLKSIKI